MFSRPALAFFALAVAELFVLTQAASAFGFGIAILALMALSVSGVLLLKRGGIGFLHSSVSRVVGDKNEAAEVLADRAMVILAAVLLIVPGFVTALAGILLFVPPIRAATRPMVLHRIQPWIQPNLQFGRSMRFGRDVVDVDVVDVQDINDESSQTPRSELN